MREKGPSAAGAGDARDNAGVVGRHSPGVGDTLTEGGALADDSGQGTSRGRRSLRRVRRVTFLGAVSAAVLLAAAIVLGGPPAGHPATMTTGGRPAPVSAKSAAAGEILHSWAPLRLVYPGAGADITVRPLTPTAAQLAAGEVDPPETQDAYWLTNYGRPGVGSTDTTFLIGHRWVGQDAPFNRIGNIAKLGDRLTLRTQNAVLSFTVSMVTTLDKATLNTAPIWKAVPGRVVMITCDLHDPWGKNTVITADPTSPKP